MDFHNWKFQDDTPVYLQLYNKLLYAILRGELLFTQVESQRLFELFEKLVPCKGLYNRFSGYPKVRFHGSSLVYKVAFPGCFPVHK